MHTDSRSSHPGSPALKVRREGDAGDGRGAPLALSVALHAGLASALVFAAWMLRKETVEDSFVVEPWIPPSAAEVAGARTVAAGGEGGQTAAPDFRVEMARRQRAEERRAEREIARIREQRRLEAEREAAAPRPTRIAAEATDAPTAQERRRTISYRDFRGKTTSAPDEAVARARTEAGSSVRIDLSAIAGAGTGPAAETKAGPGAAADGAEALGMARYFDDLLARLQAAHEKLAGLDELLLAEVGFRLAADGTISELRILRSSGDAAFDRSVLAAFARVKMPARPDGLSDLRRLTFRIRET